MKKKDLKTGMLVKDNEGDIGLVINEQIMFKEGYLDFCRYDHDLTHVNGNDRYKIMMVSRVLTGNYLRQGNWYDETLKDNLLWEREKYIKEYTIEQLQEKLGEEFKIIK